MQVCLSGEVVSFIPSAKMSSQSETVMSNSSKSMHFDSSSQRVFLPFVPIFIRSLNMYPDSRLNPSTALIVTSYGGAVKDSE